VGLANKYSLSFEPRLATGWRKSQTATFRRI
jgi:hypothetical protein